MKALLAAAALVILFSPVAHGEEDSLSAFNGYARQLYAESRHRHRDAARPVIVLVADQMILIHAGGREEHGLVSNKFNVLKIVDHIPLAIFSVLNQTDGMLSAQEKDRLTRLKSMVETLKPDLAKTDLDKGMVERQITIINQSLQFIDQRLSTGNAYKNDLRKFCRQLSPSLMLNADDAIADQLADIDEQLTIWRKQLTPEEWHNLRVVIISGHMPREQNSHFQYFSKLLKEKREGDRIVYGEGLTTEAEAMTLLATHIIDEGIARDFFADRWRMHRDLLSDGAKRYLRKHGPK